MVAKGQDSHPPKILVVEDEPAIVKVLLLFLRKEGYDVVTAIDGREGLEFFYRERPDLIVGDILMPNVDGYEMIREIRRSLWGSTIPILLYTNLNTAEVLPRIRQYEDVDCVPKAGTSLRELVAIIRAHLRKAKQREKKESL